MAEIVSKRDRLREILVKAKSTRDRAADRGNFNCVSQPGAKVIARAVEKNLCLIFQAAKCLRVNDPRPIAFVFRAMGVQRLAMFASGGIRGTLGVRYKALVLD
jgi:hypothetical protein